MSLDEQKRRVEDKCDIWHALMALDHSITPRLLDILTRTRRLVDTGTAERLSQAEFILEANIQNAERHAGYKGDHQFLLDLGRDYHKRHFELVNFPKWFIDSQLFRSYEKVIPYWKIVRPHTLVHVDFTGKDLDTYLPEASLYEDMCYAFNQAVASKGGETKSEGKAHTFYIRTTIIAAFNFVECYFNGLAFDFVTTTRRTLSQAARDLLSEWDSKHKRQRFVKFRDKAVQYPKIILNRKIPPFQESSCKSLDVLMQHINLRDAVVHSSPRVIDGEVPKVRNLVEMRFDDAVRVADAAVDFVKHVDDEIYHGKYDNTWLFPRSADSRFPAESFA